MSIRPVVNRFPSSKELWEETNLPLCVVVTPCADKNNTNGRDDDDDTKKGEGGGSAVGVVNGTDADAVSSGGGDGGGVVAEPLSSIVKCLNCGAPHPPTSVGLTHYRPSKSTLLLCFLCGKTSSTLFTDQESARNLDEYLDIDVFDKVGKRQQLQQQHQRTMSAKSRRSGHAAAATTTTTTATASTTASSSSSLAATSSTKTSDCVDFRLPLEVFHHSAIATSSGDNDEGEEDDDDEERPPSITWQLPAMTCPPVWWIVIDGTVTGPSASQYYTTISQVVQEALLNAPSHVHVGLVTATSSKICSWDLSSPVPHIQQYPYNYEPVSRSNGEREAASGANGKTSKGSSGSKNISNKKSSSPAKDATAAAVSASSPIDLCIVPVGGFKSNIQAALRAMSDAASSGAFLHENDDDERDDDDDDDDENQDTKTKQKKDNTANKSKKKTSSGKKAATASTSTTLPGIPLSTTLEVLLEYMSIGQHPGQDEVVEIDVDEYAGADDAVSSRLDHIRYAGGRILCLLGNPPTEMVAPNEDSMSNVGQEPFYDGGVAGVCFAQDSKDRWSTKRPPKNPDTYNKNKKNKKGKEEEEESDPTDLTPENMKDYVVPLDPENLFSTIGKRCAQAAFGVDLLVVVPEPEESDDGTPPSSLTTTIPWYGLPLLRVLADTSGAPGPLIFGSSQPDAIQRIGENILARTPWQAGMVFGAKLRLRTSPGFDLEDTPVEEKRKTKLQLATMLSSGGIMGPAFACDDPTADSGGFSSPDDSGLWVLGTCDPYTSLAVDLQPSNEIEDKYVIDGFGEVNMTPVIQICLLYTCIETDDEDPDKHYTVCKMKVSSISVPLATSVERILDYLDPEALALVLAHKIALDGYLDGLVSAQGTAEAWLRSLLVLVYVSAQLEQAKVEQLEDENEESADLEDVDINPNFVAVDRLLDQDGEMEVEDVLLGKGHSKVAVLPLLVFALMQCDALRPTGGNFRPSMDARLCAMSQMASMSPSILAKSIAPSLSLWSLKDDKVLVPSLPLSVKGIISALAELDIDVENDDDTVIFFDSPRRMMLYPVSQLWDNVLAKGRKKSKRAKSPSKKTKNPKKKQPFTIGSNLEDMIRSCLDDHRTAPAGWTDLEDALEDIAGGKDPTYEPVPYKVFENAMIEDKPTWNGISKDFAEWKTDMATTVQDELVKSGDLVEEE